MKSVKEKISIPVTMQTLELSLYYLLSISSINKKFIRNVENLLEAMDMTPYETDDYQIFVIKAIKWIAELRAGGVCNIKFIKTQIYDSGLDKSYIDKVYDDMAQIELTKEEYDHIVKVITDYIDYAYVYYARPSIMKCYDELMSANGNVTSDAIEALTKTLEITLSNIRISDASKDDNGISFNTKNNKFPKTELNKNYDAINNPSNIFVTGLQELNRFLNGGYERSKTYIWYAPTNSFKSAILLYNALWIMSFNPNIKPKFQNKKVAVLLLLMENSEKETLERIFAIYSDGLEARGVSKEIWDNKWQEIYQKWNNFAFYIKYVSPGMTPLDIECYVKSIEDDDDVEICTVVIDHLGNVGYATKRNETYNAIKDTTYALSDWAKRTDRLLITAMHTNSEFDVKIAEAKEQGKTNLVRSMGRHCIADAKAIDRVVDQSIYILKEYNPYDGQWYIGFKYEKVRGHKSTGSDIFYHRLKNEIILEFDYGLPICKSFPCMPGSGNTIQQQQSGMQMQNINYGNMYNNSMIPNNSAMGMNVFGKRHSNKHNYIPPQPPQIQVQFNEPTDLGMTEYPKNTNIIDNFEEDDNISDSDFDNDVEDENELLESSNEITDEDSADNGPNDEDFKDPDSEFSYVSDEEIAIDETT